MKSDLYTINIKGPKINMTIQIVDEDDFKILDLVLKMYKPRIIKKVKILKEIEELK